MHRSKKEWPFGARLNTTRGVAQLVEYTSGGRVVAGSSPVTPTNNSKGFRRFRLKPFFVCIRFAYKQAAKPNYKIHQTSVYAEALQLFPVVFFLSLIFVTTSGSTKPDRGVRKIGLWVSCLIIKHMEIRHLVLCLTFLTSCGSESTKSEQESEIVTTTEVETSKLNSFIPMQMIKDNLLKRKKGHIDRQKKKVLF